MFTAYPAYDFLNTYFILRLLEKMVAIMSTEWVLELILRTRTVSRQYFYLNIFFLSYWHLIVRGNLQDASWQCVAMCVCLPFVCKIILVIRHQVSRFGPQHSPALCPINEDCRVQAKSPWPESHWTGWVNFGRVQGRCYRRNWHWRWYVKGLYLVSTGDVVFRMNRSFVAVLSCYLLLIAPQWPILIIFPVQIS